MWYFWFTNNTDLNEKIKTLARKPELKAEKFKILKILTRDLSLFIVKVIFSRTRAQNIYIFWPILNAVTIPTGITDTIPAWQMKKWNPFFIE